jgi:RsiW-degrading membrane proteinase PrsW (M82 family)
VTPSAYRIVGALLVVLGVAMAAIVGRIFVEYQEHRLTTRKLLVGGFLFAAMFGLALASAQTLIMGPAL